MEDKEEDDGTVCTPRNVIRIFAEANLNCNLRVLGSQLGLDSSHLNEIERLPYNQQTIEILERCLRSLQGLSWSLLVRVLRRPSLKEYSVASSIERFASQSRSTTSDSSSHREPVLQSLSTSTSSPESSITSNMDAEQELTIPNVVNEIADVTNWQELGILLGLNTTDIKRIGTYYDSKEHHQQCIETWFARDTDRSWEKLHGAMDEVSVSSDIPSTPTSPMDIEESDRRESHACAPFAPTSPSVHIDTESRIEELERRFSNMQIATRKELDKKEDAVDLVKDQLVATAQTEHLKKITAIARRKRPFKNLTEFFVHLQASCWSFLEYHLLKQLIINTCSQKLKEEIKLYAKDVQVFQQRTTITEFIKYRRHLAKTRSIPKSFKKLTLDHAIDPDFCTLADLESFRLDTCMHVKLADFALQVYKVTSNCIIVEWLVPEEIIEILSLFYTSKDGQDLLLRHSVEKISIDERTLNSWLLLACVKNGDREKAMSILQEKYTDNMDLNCQDCEDGRTALFHAAVGGNVELVKKLLERGAELNIGDDEGKTTLMAAVENGQEEVIKVILEPIYQCDTNIQEKVRGWSVLHIAADKGFTDIFEILSDPTYEVDTTLRDKDGKTALQIAEEKEQSASDTEAAEKERSSDSEAGETAHVQRKGWLMRMKDWWDKNRREIRLTTAVISGSLADVQKALDNGANPNRIINRMTQRTPLLEACQRGHTEVVRLLLSRGANPNWRAAEDWNALVLASRNGHVKTVELLLSWTPSCRELVNVKAGYYGWTPLHTTCYYNSYELTFTSSKEEFLKRLERVTELLLDNGADATITDRHGETPLTYASDKGYAAIAELIIHKTPEEKRQALLNYQKKDSLSALLLASKQGHIKIVRSLLEAGASMTVTTKSKMTALHLGVSSGHVEVVEELASRADPSAINAVDKHGLTPLILATKLKNIKLIEVLHEHGADVNLKNKEKKTALMYAAKLDSIAVINLLLQYKADLFAKDSNQQTARTLATDKEVKMYLDKLIKDRLKQQMPMVQSDIL